MGKVYAWEVTRLRDMVQLLPAGEVVVACTWREPMSRCLAWSANSTMLVAAGGSDEVIWTRAEVERCGTVAEQAALVWSFEGGEMRPVGRLVGPARPITSVSWSPDGSRIVGGSLDGQVRVWFVGSSAQIREMSPISALLVVSVCVGALPAALRRPVRKAPGPRIRQNADSTGCIFVPEQGQRWRA
jgi:WD40 repeat protein